MRIPGTASKKYGIVIDSGSSGSRIQIYQWEDQAYTKQHAKDEKDLASPPKITQEKGWTQKITPGISTFGEPKKIKKIWSQHYSKLMKLAEQVIPADQHSETPVYVLATAGMRLLSPEKQKLILKETCLTLQKNTNFYIPNCKDFVQIIDGETEGIYGWLGLNYLMGQFNNYGSVEQHHESIGFMDMGGASTQIAFVPSSEEEITKHDEDLSLVTLRNINGETQQWRVFVETWLGFGANEARKRYLNQLISLSTPSGNVVYEIHDPCLPKGATVSYDYNGKKHDVKGLGNYELCLKEIYPLLMKNIPCKDTPCLFNGIHGPKLDFDKDKFIGISEYWYTANDVFQSGGEYNFHGFNEKVREYCESDWSQILTNAKAGQYSNLDPEKFLKDACFKASWVINILHEGFELPRQGIEVGEDSNKEQEKEIEEISNVHVPFKSAESVNGDELSWTLGKILLYASSQIESQQDVQIGIAPSAISHQKFVPGGVIDSKHDDSDSEDDEEGGHFIFSFLFIMVIFFFLYHFGRSFLNKHSSKLRKIDNYIPPYVKKGVLKVASKVPYLNKYLGNILPYSELPMHDSIILEEGTMSSSSNSPLAPPSLSVLRTRSTVNLADSSEDVSSSRNVNFMNKPFVVPKRNAATIYSSYGENKSRDSLLRISSNTSVNKTRAQE